MDSKKRKTEENGATSPTTTTTTTTSDLLTLEDFRKILEPFTPDQLLDIVATAATTTPSVLDAVRAIADGDATQRKLFIRGLGWDTTTDKLRSLFSAYGELSEAVVILDKVTGKSKGYGFITFKHIDGAVAALKEPSKKIDGRMTVTQLASAGTQGAAPAAAVDVSARKVFVGNVPFDMPADRLLLHFSNYGEIEEGPLGYDKQTGKSRGFALFVFKTIEAAKASIEEPIQTVDGHQLAVKFAADSKKGKPGFPQIPGAQPGQVEIPDMAAGLGGGYPAAAGAANPIPSQYGAGGGIGVLPYAGYSQNQAGIGGYSQNPVGISGGSLGHHLNSPGLSSVSSQVPSSLGGGYGGGYGVGGGAYGVPGSGGYGGLGSGSSLYRLPPSTGAAPAGAAYPETGHYGLTAYQSSQMHQPSGTSPVPRVPTGGMYQNLPPYY